MIPSPGVDGGAVRGQPKRSAPLAFPSAWDHLMATSNGETERRNGIRIVAARQRAMSTGHGGTGDCEVMP